MSDPKVIKSKLSRTVEEDGTSVDICIYRLEDEDEWLLEIVDENWNSTFWDGKFATEEDALAVAIAAIKTESIWSFVSEDDEENERPLVH